MRLFRSAPFHCHPDAGGAGGGGGAGAGAADGGAGTGTATPPARRRNPDSPYRDDDDPAPSSFPSELIARYGTPQAAIAHLLQDNRKLRRQRKELRESLTQAEQVVPKGAVILAGPEATAWNEYRALGPVADLKTKLSEASKLGTQLTEQTRAAARTAAAKAHGFNDRALSMLLKEHTLDLDLRDEDVKVRDAAGVETVQRSKVAYVRKAGVDNATWERLTAVIERDMKDDLPLLKAGADGTGGAAGSGTGSGEATVTYSDNGGSRAGGGGSGNAVEKFIQKRNEAAAAAPNPLIPAQKSTKA